MLILAGENMMLHASEILKTAVARMTVVVFIFLFFSVYVYNFNNQVIIPPTELYGYSVTANMDFDNRSPTGRVIADTAYIPNRWTGVTFSEYQQRCGSLELAQRGVLFQQRTYRDVLFCNPNSQTEQSADMAFKYFKLLIDDLYWKYYMQHLERILLTLGIAIAGAFGFLAAARIVNWVRGGA